jgi:hypothetical protein
MIPAPWTRRDDGLLAALAAATLPAVTIRNPALSAYEDLAASSAGDAA